MPSFKRLLCAGVLGGTDPDALAWAAAVTANGGTYSASTLSAVSTFCKAAKANGYWSKLNRINLFCGNQLAAALVPLKVGSGNATDTNVNFVAGDYSEATGLTGNATNKYLDTGVLQTALDAGSRHLAVYQRSATQVSRCLIGSAPGASNTNQWSLVLGSPVTVGSYRASAAASGPATTNPGHVVGVSTSTTSATTYINGGGAVTGAITAATPGAVTMSVFGLNVAGTVGSITDASMGAYSMGTALTLTAAEVAAYYTDMQAFQVLMGRQV